MPIYVYEREDGSTFEVIQRMSDDALTTCPDTGQKVQRQISASTPIFKGSGFYQTDYCSSSSNGASQSSSSSSSDSSSGSDSSSSKSDKPKACGTGCGCH